MKISIGIGISVLSVCAAQSQTTVPFSSAGWTDFGSVQQAQISGNFAPGWTVLDPDPDLSTGSVLGNPHQTLSGSGNDAGLWLLRVVSPFQPGVFTERAQLSLSGLTAGNTYSLDFSATILTIQAIQWNATSGTVGVDLTGANIATFTSSNLVDPVDNDGMNVWASQELVFTATNSNVTFDFYGASTGGGPIGRFGVDGFSIKEIPEPSSVSFMGMSALALLARRKRA